MKNKYFELVWGGFIYFSCIIKSQGYASLRSSGEKCVTAQPICHGKSMGSLLWEDGISAEGIVFYSPDFNWDMKKLWELWEWRQQGSQGPQMGHLGGCRAAQALLSSQLNSTELTRDSEVQISLEMHVWDNCFCLKMKCPEQEHWENTGNR